MKKWFLIFVLLLSLDALLFAGFAYAQNVQPRPVSACVAHPSDQTCDAQNPYITGCSKPKPIIVYSKDIYSDRQKSDKLATFQILYSRTCKSAWAELVVFSPTQNYETGASIDRPDGMSEGGNQSRSHDVYTPLLYAGEQQVRGCAILVDIIHWIDYSFCSDFISVT